MKAFAFHASVPRWLAINALGPMNRRLFYSGPLEVATGNDAVGAARCHSRKLSVPD
jgi:hypothetical protein